MYGLPANVLDLVKHLDERYPDRCLRPGESLEDAHRAAGARAVVDYLTDLRDNPEVPF